MSVTVVALFFALWSVPVPQRDYPIKGVLDHTVKLAPGARVTLNELEGPLTVEISDSNVAEIHWTREARTQKDYDCETVEFNEQPTSLEIMHRTDRSCHIIQARETMRLVLPRSTNFKASSIEGGVTTGDLGGALELDSVEGNVKAGAVRSISLENVEGDVVLTLTADPTEDTSIVNVEGDIDLTLPEGFNASMRLSNISHKVDWGTFSPVTTRSDDERAYATLGRGGRIFRISNVEGSLRLRARN